MSYTDQEIKHTILQAILDKKGQQVFDFDLSTFDHVICQNFIICHGDSTTQVGAIANGIISEVKEKLDVPVWNKTGFENNFWVIVDYGSITVHIFLKEYRDFYKLEDLWADAEVKLIEEA